MALDIDRVAVHGTWWRQAASGLDPLALREPPADGRWQRGEVCAATYLADSEETVWAEWYRALAELALSPRVWLPCALWRVRVDLAEIADLSTSERLAAVGLSPPRPGRESWPAHQAVGERVRAEGLEGLLAPSAARAEGRVLCVFRTGGNAVGLGAMGRGRRVCEPPTPPRGLRT
ncbi:MAG: RES domain-containing protein [Solirubrobacterales bacterium]|nr:RES domain-containing protein [Solirubrobacterales bacterium]